jgi:hypothetical protein
MDVKIFFWWGMAHIIYGAWASQAGKIWFLAGTPLVRLVSLNRETHKWVFWGAVVTQYAFGAFLVLYAMHPKLFH